MSDSSASAPLTTARRSVHGTWDLWGFFAFSHGWTWLFWGLIIGLGLNVWASTTGLVFLVLGGLGLPLGAVVMTGRVAGRNGLRDLGRRLVQPGRIPGRWWAAVLLLMPAVKLSAGGLAVLFGVTDAPFNLEEATALIARPGELLAYLGFLLLLGPLPEEIGWRGYLLDRLQLRFSALGASLLLGLAWFAWHGPLFFMTGYFARAGGAPDPLQFGVMILLISVLYTWIHNHTGRSVLAAVLFHFSVNAAGELLDAPDSVAAYEAYLTAALVLIVLWGWGAETLRGAEAEED